MFANFATAISSSTAVTLALLYVMNLLIDIQPAATVEPREPMTLAWVRVPEPETPPDTLKPPIDRKTLEPPVPPTSEAPGETDSEFGISRPKVAPPPVGPFRGMSPIIQDGPPVALVRVSPTYPARAQQAGLEGWVLVRFDVLADGTIANIAVVESSDYVFENAARKAAARFRFKPRVVDGIAQVTSGVQNLFRFRMED